MERLDALARTTRTDAFLLGILVLLALVDFGLTRALGIESWEYWLAALVIYASVGITRVLVKGWSEEAPLIPKLIRAALHWTAPLVLLVGLFFFEHRGQVATGAAATSTLLLITASCFTAGLHLDPIFLPLSGVLLVMACAEMVVGEAPWAVWTLSLVASGLAVVTYALIARSRARFQENL